MSTLAPTLFLVRGLPGSGKSTVANNIRQVEMVFSTDDYFMVNGEYKFDPSKLGQAHFSMQRNVLEYLQSDNDCNTVVANTFTQRWEMEPYLKIAEQTGARVVVIDCFDGGMTDEELAAKNVHGVPQASITAMRARWEHDWRKGRTKPPARR